jgi:hypothetical protein
MDKGGRNKRIRFFTGDIITFKTHESRKYTSGLIEHIGDSVTISKVNYGIDEFYKLKVDREPEMRALYLSGAVYLPVAACVFLLAEGVSSQLHGDYPLLEQKQIKLAAGLVLAGLIMYRLSYRIYKIGEKHPLKIYNLSNPDLPLPLK